MWITLLSSCRFLVMPILALGAAYPIITSAPTKNRQFVRNDASAPDCLGHRGQSRCRRHGEDYGVFELTDFGLNDVLQSVIVSLAR